MKKKRQEKDMTRQVVNPYLPEGEYIPDGEPHVFGDRVYVYGSHDKANSLRYCPGDYVVWSAPVNDLGNWSNPGVAYPRRGVRNRLGIRCMWAPDCCRGRDGRFYLYYCFDFDNRILVAVSDYPDREFSFYGYVHHADGTLYGQGKRDIMCFDPGVFVDDDGAVYLYSGYSANEDLRTMLNRRGISNVDGTGNQVIRLQEDMLTIEGEPKSLIPGYKNSLGTGFEGHEMYEASSMRKIKGKYYFIYSSRLSHELAYAISDYPDRDFRFGGAIVSNGDIGYHGAKQEDASTYWGNVHGSIERIDGKYYVFYHRQTGKTEQSRQGCIEPIHIKEDGSIDQVEVTSQGANGRPLSGKGYYPSYIACNVRSKKGAIKCAYGPLSRFRYGEHPCIAEYQKGKQCIRNMKDGALAGFKYFSLQGKTALTISVRGSGGEMEIYLEEGGQPIGRIPFVKNKKWQNATAILPFPEKESALYFVYRGSGKIDWKGFTMTPVEKK